MSRPRPIRPLSSRIAWSCPWYRVRQDEILLPDGRQGVYNVVEHPGAAFAVPVTAAGEVIMLYTYRYAVDDWCWEVPAGGIKPGYTPEEAAREELAEEVGGRATAWRYVGRFYPSNGVSNEIAHVFLATGVTLGATAQEPAEIIEVHHKPVVEALSMARSGEIMDGSSALALLLCAPYLE